MSGPIVRKYGFPNFESIFGKRELEHGVDENPTPETEGVKPEPPAAPKEAKAKGPKKKKA